MMVLYNKGAQSVGSRRLITLIKCGWLLGLILGCVLSSTPVPAQQPPALLPPSPAAAVPNALPKPSSHDILSDDPRLDAKVTLLRREVTVDVALAELTKQTKIKLAAGGNELPATIIAVAVRGEPLRDVLRALASLNGFQWKRVDTPEQPKTLVLDTSRDPQKWDFARPHNQTEADEHQAIQGFADAAAQLPPALRQALADDGAGVAKPGVPYRSLPPEMQQQVQTALKAELEKLSAINFHSNISPDSLDATRVSLKTRPDQGLTGYTLNVSTPDGGNVMMACAQPTDPSERNDAILPPSAVPFQVAQRQVLEAWYDSSRAKAVKDDPRLSQIVSVKTEDTSLSYPLSALADAAHVNIVAQVVHPTHTISLGPIPLKDALDQIAAKYGAVWGVAADGTILVGFRMSNGGGQGQKTATK